MILAVLCFWGKFPFVLEYLHVLAGEQDKLKKSNHRSRIKLKCFRRKTLTRVIEDDIITSADAKYQKKARKRLKKIKKSA